MPVSYHTRLPKQISHLNETNWELLSEKGDWGTMTVGTVTTGAAGSDVVITNVGTDTDAILDIAYSYRKYLYPLSFKCWDFILDK